MVVDMITVPPRHHYYTAVTPLSARGIEGASNGHRLAEWRWRMYLSVEVVCQVTLELREECANSQVRDNSNED